MIPRNGRLDLILFGGLNHLGKRKSEGWGGLPPPERRVILIVTRPDSYRSQGLGALGKGCVEAVA